MEESKDRSAGWADDCPCTLASCTYHGNCVECVRVHRTQKLHVPECMAPIIREEIISLAGKVECGVIDNRPAFKRAREKGEPPPGETF